MTLSVTRGLRGFGSWPSHGTSLEGGEPTDGFSPKLVSGNAWEEENRIMSLMGLPPNPSVKIRNCILINGTGANCIMINGEWELHLDIRGNGQLHLDKRGHGKTTFG